LVSRASVRRALAVSGAVLIAGLLLAPSLPPSAILPVSLLWYASLIVLVRSAYLVLHHLAGRRAAVLLIVLGLAAPVLLTSVPASPSLAMLLPCPRNWGWQPTWLLRPSPMGALTLRLDGARVKLCYGRPAARGRTMIGGKHVPFGRLWRTGANEPTTIISTVPLTISGIRMPAGRASLYTVPGPESWEIILNRSTSQWGIESEYTDTVRAGELGRAIVPSARDSAHIERLTLEFERKGADAGDLVLAWESTRVRIPLQRAAP
jgi:hypothetical protein